MTDWPIERIDNHAEQALGRFTSQYAHAETLRDVTGVFVGRYQTLEDVVQELLRNRWIEGAQGQQLDELGAIVGEPRLERIDEAYRPAIILRAELNRSGGEPEAIIDWVRRTFQAPIVVLIEMYPAKIEVYTRLGLTGDISAGVDLALDDGDILALDDGDTLELVAVERTEIAQQVDQIKKIVAAGVGTVYFSESDQDIAFGTAELTGAEFDLAFDDGDLLAFDDGDTLEVLDGSIANRPPSWVKGMGEINYWILYDGRWNDAGEWADPALWYDSQPADTRDNVGVIAELYEV